MRSPHAAAPRVVAKRAMSAPGGPLRVADRVVRYAGHPTRDQVIGCGAGRRLAPANGRYPRTLEPPSLVKLRWSMSVNQYGTVTDALDDPARNGFTATSSEESAHSIRLIERPQVWAALDLRDSCRAAPGAARPPTQRISSAMSHCLVVSRGMCGGRWRRAGCRSLPDAAPLALVRAGHTECLGALPAAKPGHDAWQPSAGALGSRRLRVQSTEK